MQEQYCNETINIGGDLKAKNIVWQQCYNGLEWGELCGIKLFSVLKNRQGIKLHSSLPGYHGRAVDSIAEGKSVAQEMLDGFLTKLST